MGTMFTIKVHNKELYKDLDKRCTELVNCLWLKPEQKNEVRIIILDMIIRSINECDKKPESLQDIKRLMREYGETDYR